MKRHQVLGATAGALTLGPVAAVSAMHGVWPGVAAAALMAAGGAYVLRKPLVIRAEDGGDISSLDARPSPLMEFEGRTDIWQGIPYGFDSRGNVLTATMQHMIVAGAQGSGKSVMVNNLLAFLTRDPNVRLAIIDGKGGLSHVKWSPCAYHFDRSKLPESLLKFLTGVISDMRATYERLLEMGLEEIEPGCGLPVTYIVIDEFANFSEGANKKMNDAIKQAVAEISMQGREAGFFLILATQHPSTSAVPSPIRNNLPQRFCFRVENAQASNMVLGGGMATKGYDASQIHMLKEKGVGYCSVDGRPTVKFRAFLITRDDKATLAEVSKSARGITQTASSAAADSFGSAETVEFPAVETRNLLDDIQSIWCSADRLHNSVILARLQTSYDFYAGWSAQRFGRALTDVGLARFKVQFTEPGRVNHWGLPKSALFAHTEADKSSSKDRREREEAAFDALDDLGKAEYIARLAEIAKAERCSFCKRRFEDNETRTVDHLIPLNKGGGNDPWNLIPACHSCNSSKRDKDVYEWLNDKKRDF